MKPLKEYKAEVLDRLEQLIGAAKERDLIPLDISDQDIDKGFEMVNSSDVIYMFNETDVTYEDYEGEDNESSYDDLAIEDLAEIIDILETVIEEHDVDY